MNHLTISQHFHKAGLAHLFRHATLTLFLTGEARCTFEKELRHLLTQIGVPSRAVDHYAVWTIRLATLHLVGRLSS